MDAGMLTPSGIPAAPHKWEHNGYVLYSDDALKLIEVAEGFLFGSVLHRCNIDLNNQVVAAEKKSAELQKQVNDLTLALVNHRMAPDAAEPEAEPEPEPEA